jgi:hypothetical protein
MSSKDSKSPMVVWRKNNPEKARAQRERELENRKARRDAKREELRRQQEAQGPPQDKQCSLCKTPKPFAAFNKKRRSKDGYRPECRECQAQHHANNKDKAQARNQKRKPEIAAYSHQYHIEHRDSILKRHSDNRRMNPEARSTYGKKYRTENLAYFRMAAMQRRARKKGLPDTWTYEQEHFMLQYWDNACAACGTKEGLWWTIAQDHWIPLTSSDCPGNTATNIVPLCHTRRGNHDSCNNSKYNLDPHTWLIRRFGTKKAAKVEKDIAIYFALIREKFCDITS